MALPLMLIGLAASAIGAGIKAGQNANANKIAEENYRKSKERLFYEKYANPLDSVTNKAILSQMDRRLNKYEDRIANQAAAGGATFENVLAAKQASNEAMADVVSGMMQGEQARQDKFNQQLLNIDSQRTAQQIAAKRASGDAWAQLGNNVFGSATQLGGVMLEHEIPMSDLFKWK
jgi:hypothetical protein